jgi:hypothetical protein
MFVTVAVATRLWQPCRTTGVRLKLQNVSIHLTTEE